MSKKEFSITGRNGYEISCMEWNCEGEKAVLVCLHGFAGDKYSSVIEALAEVMNKEVVHVITFDWPGHGSSPVDGACLTIENCLSDLDCVLETVQEKGLPMYLFATSFGAFLGLNYITRHPEVFSKVVLRSPALNMPDTYHSFLTDEQIKFMEQGGTLNAGFERPLELGKSFYEDLCQHRLPLDAFPVKMQGLIIQGDQDDVVDPQDSVRFAQKNGLELHMVNGADHRYKKPGNMEEILEVTTKFLKD